MIIPDVNVLIYAHRAESPLHERMADWLDHIFSSGTVGLSDVVLAAFIRIVTQQRFAPAPSPASLAFGECKRIRAHPNARLIPPTARTWPIFEKLCIETGVAGRHVADAYLAAIAIENGAELASTDVGFARFEGLRWRNPLAN